MTTALATSKPSACARGQTVVVAGALAQRPGVPGHAWVFLNWLHGLRSLGFDVLFVDRLEPEMQTDSGSSVQSSREWAWLSTVMGDAGFGHDVALLYDDGRSSLGMDRAGLDRRSTGAIALFNFMGYLADERILDSVGTRIFVDIDPGFGQLWRMQGLHDPFLGHDAVATVGLQAGVPGCLVGNTGLPTVATLPPVSLNHWGATPLPQRRRARLTSIATWRGPFAAIHHEGVRFGLRAHEFRHFVDVPVQVPEADFEVALDIDDADAADRARLLAAGWTLTDPTAVAAESKQYRDYIVDSTAEFVIAKEMYVRSGGGWFSDRSACYLASGRPVIAQDTGFSAHLPTGDGLVCFSDPGEAARAVQEVLERPDAHARAARQLAEEHLDASRVITTLLERLDVV
jgi:hypothetical protein